jgi:hypothetical protein
MSYAVPLLAQQTGFAWGEEAVAFKTKAAALTEYLRVLSHKPPVPVREYEEVWAHGHGFEPAYVNDEKRWKNEGSFQFEVVNGRILGGILGTVVTTGADPYEHLITIKQGMPPSFSVSVPFISPDSANVIMEFLGCRFNTFKFKSTEDDETLKIDADYMACIPQDGGVTPPSVSLSTAAPFVAKQGVFSSTSMYATAKARVYDFEFNINRNLKPVYGHGNEFYPYDIVPGKTSYSDLILKVGLEDDTEWDEIIGPPGTIYDYAMLYTRGANDDLKISGNAKYVGMPLEIEEHEVRANLQLVPYGTATIEVNDSDATYPFE